MSTEKKLAVEKFDRNMAVKNVDETEMKWFSADDEPLRLTGFYFRKKGGLFRRFDLDDNLPPAVNGLAWHTAGGQLSFISNTKVVRLKVTLGHESLMDHCTKIGSSGFDIYMGKPGGKQYFCGSSRIKVNSDSYEVDLFKCERAEMREFTVNFPLYCGVDSFEIGFDADAEIKAPTPWKCDKPVVVYGTSITQGGCANRPGMAYTNIISRRLNRPFLNFGFSGSGRGEPYVFEQLAKVEDPAMFILDYEANANTGIWTTLSEGIDILRAKHPDTPIMVVSKFHFNREYVETGSLTARAPAAEKSWKFERAEVNRRRRAGDKNITFVYGGWKNEKDWTEFTVDGVHATDLGFYMFAKMLTPKIAKVLDK